MKLSVVIPVYNEKTTLKEIIEKVKAVEGLDVEIILVDDASTDGSIGISRKQTRAKERHCGMVLNRRQEIM